MSVDEMAKTTNSDDAPKLADRPAVSIVGYSLRAPNCSSVAEFAQALASGQDLTTSDTRYPSGLWGLPPRQGRLKQADLQDFFPTFFGLSRKMVERMDPAVCLLLKVSYEALMDAQINIESIRGSNTGVYAGHCFCDMTTIRNGTSGNLSSSSFDDITGYEILGTAHCMAANRLSYFYDFKGPSMTLDTACSSSLLALDRAARDIAAGLIDRALVCGISLTLDHGKNVILANAKMLSPTGHCHVFDTRADGYCRADGVACVVLERSPAGYAQIVGSGTNQDGATTAGITYPSAEMQYALMTQVLADSGVDPTQVVYHEAHGTGTVAGDQQELLALSKTFPQQPQPQQSLVIGSVKSNMGHAEGASGLMGIAKILLMMEDKLLYPNHDFQQTPHETIQSGRFRVLTTAEPWEQPGFCTISNFGFGGSNVFAILKPCRERRTLLSPQLSLSLRKVVNVTPFAAAPVSSSSTTEATTADRYADYYAIQRAIGNDRPFRYHFHHDKWTVASPLVFVCNGQGSQWNNMGQDLMKECPVFRITIERLERETGIPLVSMYNDGSLWMDKSNSAIGIVSFQLGLIALLAEQGIQPDMFLGHSLGEITCAYLAGLQTQAEVLMTAKVRSELVSMIDTESRLDVYQEAPSGGHDYEMLWPTTSREKKKKKQFVKKVPRDSCCPSSSNCGFVRSFAMLGKMVVVGCDAETIASAIDELSLQQTVVACFNSPKGQTVSGPSAEVDQLVEHLQTKNADLFLRIIPTDDIAYHAPFLQVFRESLRARFCWKIDRQPLPASWISTSRNRMFHVDYLLDNICRPVYFQEAIKSLPNGATVVEIGPASGLLTQIRRCRNDLNLIALVERDKPMDLGQGLNELQPWKLGEEMKPVEQITSNAALHYSQRYPQLWGEHTKLVLPSWENFERFQKTYSSVKEVSYDLTKDPWSSIRDHCVRGQCIFPASGFLHILWSAAAYRECTEVLDFRVMAPMVLSTAMKKVEFHLHHAGQYFEIRDTKDEICYAVGRVQPVASHGAAFEKEDNSIEDENCDAISAEPFYNHCEFGPKYRLLKRCTTDTAIMSKPSDFIAYVDACIQMLSLTESLFSFIPEGIMDRRDIPFPIETDTTLHFPVGLDRVVFWKKNLDDAPLWLRQRGTNTVGNTAVLLEGLRRDHVQAVRRPASIHSEAFVDYAETDDPVPPSLVAAVVLRECFQYRVVEPLLSDELAAVVKILQSNTLAQESDSCQAIVFSDKFVKDADLLVTTDTCDGTEVPLCLVARWGRIRLVRIGNTPKNELKVISSWKEVPPASEPFIWQGDGSSGAAASLSIEREQPVYSYPSSSSSSFIGLEKRMRHNYILEGDKHLRHGVWVDVNQAETMQKQDKPTPFVQLRISRPGLLDALEWTAIDPELHPIKVETASLNFRDIMRAVGRLKEKDLSLGHEFSGFDTVKKQRVLGLGRNTLASRCHAAYTFPIPEHLSYEEAATIPLVYLTAYYAMIEKAEIKEGQSILIHAGAGGVGMASITIALRRGIKVFTTCSASKREFLKKRFGLPDEQIGDSRSDSFVQTVLRGTSGRGVDVVLNHLSGPLQIASLRCVAHGGHFCEIGKFDAHVNSGLGQALLANNVSFHIIDLHPLVADRSYKPIWDKFLTEGFKSEEIVPLPTTAFDAGNVVEAFRYMSQAKHVGKIVINGFGTQQFNVRHLPLQSWRETHLITGGLGGLGFALAVRLAYDGCPELILVGRKGVTTAFQRLRIRQLERLGCKITVIKASVLDLKCCDSTPDRIWHVANAYRDVRFDEMTGDHWDAVVGTKLEGYRHLRKCWPTTPIVAVSSVAAYFGNMAQVHYACANASLDDAARRDPNTISIRLGAVDNVGYVTQSTNHRRVLERSPFELMPVEDVLDRLMQITSENRSGVFGIYDLKKQISKKAQVGRDEPYNLEDAQKMLADILGGKPDQYYPTLSLKHSGLDSLSLMEVVYHIHEATGAQDFKPSEVRDDFLVQDIVTLVRAARGQKLSRAPSRATTLQVAKTSEQDPADSALLSETEVAEKKSETTSTSESDAAETGFLCPESTETSETGLRQRVFSSRMQTQSRSFSGGEVWSRERRLAFACLVPSAVWWIISLATNGVGEVDKVLLYALAVFNLFHLVRNLVNWCISNGVPIRDPVSCAHFLQHLVEIVLYVIVYAIGSDDFITYWQSIFFGYYAFDTLSVLVFWEVLVPDFRVFLTIHHTLGFTFTGMWRFREQLWDKYLALAIVLWLTSGVWQYSFMVYRHFYGPRNKLRKYLPYLFVFAFVWERAQRIAAYCVGALLAGNGDADGEKAMYAWTVFLLDFVDIWYQVRSIRKLFRYRPVSRGVERAPNDTDLIDSIV